LTLFSTVQLRIIQKKLKTQTPRRLDEEHQKEIMTAFFNEISGILTKNGYETDFKETIANDTKDYTLKLT
jgi:hypothetical protein